MCIRDRFWLDQYRPHEAQMITKVKMYLHEHNTTGLDIQIMSQVRARRYTLERVVRGLDTISAVSYTHLAWPVPSRLTRTRILVSAVLRLTSAVRGSMVGVVIGLKGIAGMPPASVYFRLRCPR